MNDGDFTFGIIVGFLLCVAVIVIPGSCTWEISQDAMTERAVKNECASYNTKTGQFEWNDEKQEKP